MLHLFFLLWCASNCLESIQKWQALISTFAIHLLLFFLILHYFIVNKSLTVFVLLSRNFRLLLRVVLSFSQLIIFEFQFAQSLKFLICLTSCWELWKEELFLIWFEFDTDVQCTPISLLNSITFPWYFATFQTNLISLGTSLKFARIKALQVAQGLHLVRLFVFDVVRATPTMIHTTFNFLLFVNSNGIRDWVQTIIEVFSSLE